MLLASSFCSTEDLGVVGVGELGLIVGGVRVVIGTNVLGVWAV